MLGSRGGAEDLGADVLGDLDRGDADAASRGVDQRPVALAKAAHHHEARVGGRVVHRDRRPLLERERVRQRQHLALGRDAHELGVAAEARAGDDAVADRVVGDALPHRLDLARDLVAHHARRLRRVRIDARARHQVGEVDARRLDGDADLARLHVGIGPLLDLQDLGAAVFGDDDSAHSCAGYSESSAPGFGHEPVAHRKQARACPCRHIRLRVDVLNVVSRGLRRNPQPLADLAAR